jgi:hypothetical protein
MNAKRTNVLSLLAGTLLMLASSLAQAQYVWVDQKGIKQFSDRPPPPSVLQKDILKQPRGIAPRTLVALDAAAAEPGAAALVAGAAAAPAGPPSLAERDAQFRKRNEEKQEQASKAAQQSAHAAATKHHCDSARANQAQLASGVRISQVDANGERRYMSDAEKAQQHAAAGRALADCN